MSQRNDDEMAVCLTFWFQDHNNARYAELFPRLSSVVRVYRITFGRHRVTRAMQYRLWRALDRRLIYPVASRVLGKRHRVLFTVDLRQIPSWKGSVVADIDDPTFDPTEIRLVKLPQVKAIVVTTESARDQYRDLGVDKPIHVIPQGISVQVDPSRLQQVRERFRHHDDIVVGYLAPTLTLSCDGPRRYRHGLDDLDFLLGAVEDARRTEPRIRLWLLGRASASLMRYVRDRTWVTLFDFVPLTDVFAHVANFDIGAYSRAQVLPPGRYSVKVAQYMACGIPVAATAVSEALVLREAGCGMICESQDAFSRALVTLARSPETRAQLGMAGKRYAQSALDWRGLVNRYESVIRDRLREDRPEILPVSPHVSAEEPT